MTIPPTVYVSRSREVTHFKWELPTIHFLRSTSLLYYSLRHYTPDRKTFLESATETFEQHNERKSVVEVADRYERFIALICANTANLYI